MNLNVRVHQGDGMLWAETPELPGCFASGASNVELIEALQEAVSLYLDAGDGEPVPAIVTAIQLRTLQPA